MNYINFDIDLLDQEIKKHIPNIASSIDLDDIIIYYNDLGIPKVIVHKQTMNFGWAEQLYPGLCSVFKENKVRHVKNGLYGLTKVKKRL